MEGFALGIFSKAFVIVSGECHSFSPMSISLDHATKPCSQKFTLTDFQGC